MTRFLPLSLYALALLAYALAPAWPAELWRWDAVLIGGMVLLGLFGIGWAVCCPRRVRA